MPLSAGASRHATAQGRHGDDTRSATARAGSSSIDWPASLAARGAAPLRQAHLRHLPEAPAESALHCFLLDSSGSMRSGGGLARAKGLLLSLLEEAYRGRARVALLCFAGETVELRLPPQRAAAWNEDWIAPIAGGGGTPLALGLAAAEQLLRRTPASRRVLWLLTDGRSREQPAAPPSADELHVVDFESARLPLGRAAQLAEAWGAAYLRDADIRAQAHGKRQTS